MSTTLDGQSLFDEQRLEIETGSVRRDSMEKTVPGLDSVLGIDLGSRIREVTQRGELRAKSRSQMDERVGAISAFIDGDTHALVTSKGEQFDDIRMDVFKVNKERVSGSGVVVDYEIIYTQLRVES